MNKAAKIYRIILLTILVLILLFFAALGVIYLYSNAVVFDHRDITSPPILSGVNTPADDYPVTYPWFGNPMMLTGNTGEQYRIIFNNGGEKNIPVYAAVNEPISMWISYLSTRYDRRFTLDYTMEQDNKSISVYFSGTAVDDDGSGIPLEQSLKFNVENASPDNLPKWINEEDVTDEYKEYLNYLYNCETAPKPAWIDA